MATTDRSKARAADGQARSERVQARVGSAVKHVIEQGAELSGLSLSDFMVNSSRERAEALIREHRVITLTTADSLAFANAILNPPEPNPALRALFDQPRVARGDVVGGPSRLHRRAAR